MLTLVRRAVPFIILIFSAFVIQAQPVLAAAKGTEAPAKPYRIQTSGKQITIKSTRDIKNVMVWSSAGNRLFEQKDINAETFNFKLNVNEKIFFIRIQLKDGKVYSEKIGLAD